MSGNRKSTIMPMKSEDSFNDKTATPSKSFESFALGISTNTSSKDLLNYETVDDSIGFAPQEDRKLVRKLDKKLLPFLSLLYLLSFLDRASIGNAKLAGMEEDLGMVNKFDYSTAVAIFFPFYVVAEIPSNIAMKRFRPSIWIPSIMVAWGTCTIITGAVKNFPSLLVVRCALGLAEGGLFPGLTYYITMWYKRQECGLRMSIFFASATAAGAFGGVIARGIMEMNGVAGLSGWNWIFILEGILTVLVAIVAYFAMHDYPDTAKFLTPVEKTEVLRRLKHDRGILSEAFKLQFVFDAFKDWKIWMQMFIIIGIFTPLYSVSSFMPTILKNLGYDNGTAQLMSVPPYAVACVFAVLGGYFADATLQRGIFIVGFNILAGIGFILLATVQNDQVKYFSCFLVVAGVYSNIPQAVAWNGNNVGGSLKRAVGIAMQIGMGNLGGAVSGFVFRIDEAPGYLSGHLILLGFVTMSAVLSAILTFYFRRENKRRDREYKRPEDYTMEEKLRETDKGDNATFFRYIY